MATLQQIAKELSVSTALVSQVLNDKPGVWASESTRSRILATAERMNYRPSRAARALVTGKTRTLAVSAADHAWHDVRWGRLAEMRGVIDAATRHDYRVLVFTSSAQHAGIKHFEEIVHSQGCDGICLYAEQANAQVYEFLREHKMPFVVIGNPGFEGVPRVDHDNFRLMFDSVAWVAAQGRKRIGYIVPTRNLQDQPPQEPFEKLLIEGYLDAMANHCGGAAPELYPAHEWNQESAVIEWLRDVRPDALLVRGLASTFQWRYAILNAGLRLPADVLIVTHLDSVELSYLRQSGLHEGLACHVHAPHAIGEQAGEILIQSINGESTPSAPLFVPGFAPCWCADALVLES